MKSKRQLILHSYFLKCLGKGEIGKRLNRIAIVYSKKFLKHDTKRHSENPLRLEIAFEALQKLGLIRPEYCEIIEPREAAKEEIALVHDENYIEEIRRFCLAGGGYYDSDTFLSSGSYNAASLAVGGILDVSSNIFAGKIKRAFGLIRPPGHHAGFSGRALGAPTVGFCVFNNVALTASHLLNKGLVERVLIFDFDVHHGNGTQEIFNSSNKVLYMSIHERGIYPGTGFEDEIGEGEGIGYKVNLPLPSRSDDVIVLKVLDEIMLPIAEQFKPEIVLVSAGFDAHSSDGISGLNLSVEGYVKMTNRLIELSEKYSKGRLVMCLEGGYSAETLSKSLPATIAAMIGVNLNLTDSLHPTSVLALKRVEGLIKSVKKILENYWKL